MTSPENTESPVLLKKSQVIHQTSQGPTVDEVAAQLLRKALKALYPNQDLEPGHVLVGTPQWQWLDGALVALPSRFESLIQILVRQFFTGARANYLEGEHFLTSNPLATPVVHLDVSIEAIAELLNDYTPLLFVGFGERQLAYWNSSAKHLPRWQELSDALRKTLDVQQVDGWDEVQCRVARAVSLHPDKSKRQAHDQALSAIRVGLIDVDTVDADGKTRHLLVGGAAVLTGRYGTRDLVMMYTVKGGYESFDTLKQLGDSLPARLGTRLAGRNMNWQLFEPEGNFFDHMAWALVASQLDAIAAITAESVAAEADDPVEAQAHTDQANAREKTSLAELDNAIPDWLFGASAVDLDDYSRSINALGKLYKQVDNDLFRIEPITTFAQQRMREAIVADQPTATALPLDKLEISITNSFESGGLTLPNPHDVHSETLGEYALQNSAPYQASIRFKPSQSVPQWLTVAYLTKMASQVDIGQHYPALIKDKLIDDTVQAGLQQRFYISQLRALLPLIALEGKIRRRGGIDERGYNYVRQWLNPTPGHPQPITIRPLTFVHNSEANGDTVDNMFIIAPRQPDGGPCLLYRPLFEQSLLQFPSGQNLLYALHQPGELRDSVLAWLPDSASSFKYAQYSFPVGLPSPWLATQLLSEPWTPVDWAGPVELSTKELTGDMFPVLFKTHAQAMAELADRQSLSNAQRRWDLLRDSGWALFNVAANFLSGPAGAAVWVWQSISEIDQALQARQHGDNVGEWSAVGDMLLNLGILLAHRAAVRRKTGTRQGARPIEPGMPGPKTPNIEPTLPTATLIPTPLTGELPSSHYSSLEANGSVPRRSVTALITYLETLTVPAPDLTSTELETLLRETAPLYRLGERTYAQVGERWFCVKENDDQQVQLVHPREPEKTGPLLVHDQQGHWFVDTRLRLRGGAGGSSLQSQLRAQRREKAQQKKTLGLAIEGFKRREAAGNATLQKAQTDMMAATGSAHELATGQYLGQVETLISDYSEALKNLHQWRLMGGSEGYLNDLLSMTTHLQKNLSLWFVLKRNAYATLTRRLAASTVIDSNVLLQTHIEGVRQALALSKDMIARLQLSATSLASLDTIGSAGMAAAQRLRQLLPSFNEWDLKSNEIGMSHELCLRDGVNVDNEAAREAVGQLIIDAATATHRHAALIRSSPGADGAIARIDALSRLIDIYADADQRLEDVPDEYPDRVEPAELERVRGVLGEFRQLAQDQLGALLPENGPSLAPALPKPVVAGPSRPPAKVTKTRPREPLPAKASSPEEASFKEILPARPKPAAPPVMDDTDVIADGLDLNENVQGFIERTRKDAAKPNRIPADMQDLFDLQALRLEQASIRVTRTMARLRATGKTTPPVGDLDAQLNSAAVRLRAAGVSTRASLLKERQPRQAYLHWLLDNQQVRIERNEQGRIKTKKRRDYFQEYRILDTANKDQPLWLAHFHYDSLEAPLEQFTAAHLKIADAHLQTFTAERRQALTALAPIDYVLRRISDATLFLKLEAQP
ncbi:hypothetical protein [Pseudomonas sp. NFX15]|uniref:hypothetical protein n=1 Tax=Pseudomonas sp. NFX15 TaxID=2816958 RepID=UPI003B8C4975